MNLDRLQGCVEALKRSPNPGKFNMRRYWDWISIPEHLYSCRSPACVLGHYQHYTGIYVTDEFDHAAKHFEFYDLPDNGWALWNQLFGEYGCGGAKTPEEAIAYLEAFIAKELPKKEEFEEVELMEEAA